MQKSYEKRKRRKLDEERFAYEQKVSSPSEQTFTTTNDTPKEKTKEKTKMNTGVNIGGQY